MTLISETGKNSILTLLVNAHEKIDENFAVNENTSVQIKTKSSKPNTNTLHISIDITTSEILPEETDKNLPYMHEVNKKGEKFIQEWDEIVSEIDWLSDKKWNFLINSHYTGENGLHVATYRERITVNIEDVLKSVANNEKLVKIEYKIPREIYTIIDKDIDIENTKEVISHIPEIRNDSLPIMESFNESKDTSNHLNPPMISIDEVEDIKITEVNSSGSSR